jgi:glutamate racemase
MTDKRNKAIGVFDSGLGGLTVVKEIIKLLPNENIIYLGDTARVPYGTRSTETIKRFSLENTQFLLQKNVKCVVIACNTSSAVATTFLKKKFKQIPIFEVISSACLEAVLMTKDRKIGVIGTRATIASHAHLKEIKKTNKKVGVFEGACPLFVNFIEEGEISGKLISSLVQKYLGKMKRNKIDVLILGCTHYPIICEILKKELPGIKLVNPAEGLAKNLKAYLTKNKLLRKSSRSGKKSYYVTDLNQRFIKVSEMFLGGKLKGNIRKVNPE